VKIRRMKRRAVQVPYRSGNGLLSNFCSGAKRRKRETRDHKLLQAVSDGDLFMPFTAVFKRSSMTEFKGYRQK